MDAPVIGRIVRYVLEDGPSKGQARPAIVVQRWSDSADGSCQLQVFTDGTNDGQKFSAGVVWRTSVHHDPEGTPGTWHWPVERP